VMAASLVSAAARRAASSNDCVWYSEVISASLANRISTEDLRDVLVGEFRRRQFMMERFEQFVRVSDDELRRYYDEVYTPEARARGERVAPLEEVSEAIRQNRALEKTNEEVGSWLMELRRRSVIEKIPN